MIDKKDVVAYINASPERLTEINIYQNNISAYPLKKYDCFFHDIGYQLSLDSDEFNYQDIYLIGPLVFCEKIAEQIQNYFSELTPTIHYGME